MTTRDYDKVLRVRLSLSDVRQLYDEARKRGAGASISGLCRDLIEAGLAGLGYDVGKRGAGAGADAESDAAEPGEVPKDFVKEVSWNLSHGHTWDQLLKAEEDWARKGSDQGWQKEAGINKVKEWYATLRAQTEAGK